MPFEKLSPIIRLEGSGWFGGTLHVALHHSLGLRRLLLVLSELCFEWLASVCEGKTPMVEKTSFGVR